jgi:hypothetical protein
MNREALSPDSPYLVIDESEPDAMGGEVETTAIFLTASQCPVGCTMCDLHHNTLPLATPPGAIPRQIEAALEGRSASGWIKLYNSGNFFDPRSIPPSDYPSIAALCAKQRASRVVVENHPKFGGNRLRSFRDLLNTPLEVAVGLETVQPRWLHRLGKQMSRDHFEGYARWLGNEGVDLRVFLIIGVPGIGVAESARWARLSVRHAVACGARHVSLIPARDGHGWNGLADRLPRFSCTDLIELQRAAISDAAGRAAVTMDLWNLDKTDKQVHQLHSVNLSQNVF